MEAARCDLCGRPVSSWLEVCDKLNVCSDCAASVTLASLAGAGYAVLKPDTFQMDGETLVTKDTPDVILDYQQAKERLSTTYGMRVGSGDAVRYTVKGEYTQQAMLDILRKSYDWTIEEIVKYIKDLGFATEKAFSAHIDALIEGGYTEETSYAVILWSRYSEQTVCDEIGTHYNALEGQTPGEAIDAMLAACRVEDAILTEEQKAKVDSLVTKGLI